MARRVGGGKNIVENCPAVDVLDWHRHGYFLSPRRFPMTWSSNGQKIASIDVETERHSATLKFRSRNYGEYWSDVEQHVAIAWTSCRFGGERPWFVCSVQSNGVSCGRRVIKLYGGGRLFACRHCCRLAYATQHEPVHRRGLIRAQKIRTRLGGSPNMLEAFPEKPKGMHRLTYERWCNVYADTAERSSASLRALVERRGHQTPYRH